MDDRADLKFVLLDNPNPKSWRSIRPNFDWYDDMHLHMIENHKRMTRLARKEGRLIMKMLNRPKEELVRKLQILRRKENLRTVSAPSPKKQDTPDNNGKHRRDMSGDDVENAVENMNFDDNNLDELIRKKAPEDKGDASDEAPTPQEQTPAQSPESDDHKDVSDKSSEGVPPHVQREKDKKEDKEKRKERRREKKRRHKDGLSASPSISIDDSDLDGLSSDEDPFDKEANNVKKNEYDKLKRLKRQERYVKKLQKLKDHYEYKFDRIREIYPDEDIPNITDLSSPHAISRQYHRVARRLKLKKSIENYSGYMSMGFMAIEYVGTNVLNMDIEGYAQEQLSNANKYNSLLVELGERKYASFGGNLPVEIRLLGIMLFQAVIFFISKKFGAFSPAFQDTAPNEIQEHDFDYHPTPAPQPSSTGRTWRGGPSWRNRN